MDEDIVRCMLNLVAPVTAEIESAMPTIIDRRGLQNKRKISDPAVCIRVCIYIDSLAIYRMAEASHIIGLCESQPIWWLKLDQLSCNCTGFP